MTTMTSVTDEMKTLRGVLKAYCGIPHKHLYQASFVAFMSKLDALPDEEKNQNKQFIDDIKTAGLKFKNGDKFSFGKDDTKLFNLTIQTVLKNLNPVKKDPEYKAPTEIKKEHRVYTNNGHSAYKISNPDVMKDLFTLPRRDPLVLKLKSHPIINELILHLMDQLNSTTMDSNLNGVVQEYYDIAGSLRQEIVECFETFEVINKCFISHGWEKNNFTCKPDRKSLQDELTSILNRMSL